MERIEFKTEGGVAYLPGLQAPVSIAPDEELERLIREARFFDLPPTVGEPPPGAADYQEYTVTVEDAGRRHSVKLTDFVQDPKLQALLQVLRDRAKTARRRP